MMIRSQIDAAIDDAIAFFREMKFPLPEYAYWTPDQWSKAGLDYNEIRELGLGWDVTDFGSGDLTMTGRTIFTLRNGRAKDPRFPKTYAQKVMCMPEGQMSITHYHKQKIEDIHNQGGGKIDIKLWKVAADGGLSNEPLTLSISGVTRKVQAGETVLLAPGDWITVPPCTYHRFGAAAGHGKVISVEISSVCDDHNDNFFLGDAGERFPEIKEDAPRRHVLCQEYPALM